MPRWRRHIPASSCSSAIGPSAVRMLKLGMMAGTLATAIAGRARPSALAISSASVRLAAASISTCG